MNAQQALNGIARAAVGIGAGVSLAQASMYTVDGGHRAVMFDRYFGVSKAVRGEGTHFRIPWLQEPHTFDVRIKPRNISSNTGTKDLQVVTINLRVLSRPEEAHLPDIFSSLGIDYDERVLPSIGNEVLKAVVAQYNAESLITKRVRCMPGRASPASRRCGAAQGPALWPLATASPQPATAPPSL